MDREIAAMRAARMREERRVGWFLWLANAAMAAAIAASVLTAFAAWPEHEGPRFLKVAE